jgi:hypothetical protein
MLRQPIAGFVGGIYARLFRRDDGLQALCLRKVTAVIMPSERERKDMARPHSRRGMRTRTTASLPRLYL